LVMSAEKRELFAGRESLGVGVCEDTTTRREQHDWRFRLQRFDCFEERLRLHHHAGAAPVRIVVDRPVLVVREISEINDVVGDTSRRCSSRWNAQAKRAGEKLGKDRDDVDSQRHDYSSALEASMKPNV